VATHLFFWSLTPRFSSMRSISSSSRSEPSSDLERDRRLFEASRDRPEPEPDLEREPDPDPDPEPEPRGKNINIRLGKKQCFGLTLASMQIQIWIQLFTSMRIQIRNQGGEPTRIRILAGLSRKENLDYDIKNILFVGNMAYDIPYLRKIGTIRYESHFERLEVRFIC
jgi:hypothetical protein